MVERTGRNGFMVNWLDAQGFVFRSHYFETADMITAYRAVWRKFHEHTEKDQVNGFLISKAPAPLLRRYFDLGIHAKPRRFTVIESHLYAPKHLLRR